MNKNNLQITSLSCGLFVSHKPVQWVDKITSKPADVDQPEHQMVFLNQNELDSLDPSEMLEDNVLNNYIFHFDNK